jgi:hypothetical protein
METRGHNISYVCIENVCTNNVFVCAGQSIYNSEYNFLPQGIKMEQFFARSFHLKKYLKLFLLGLIQKLKWEHKLDTELDGSMLFNDIYRITNDTN